MNLNYEELLIEADNNNLIVKEIPLLANDGLIKGNNIAIRENIATSTEKNCVLAEELGHYYTTVGNILDQTDINNRKQEHIARVWAYNKMISLEDIIRAFEHGCRNRYEFAEYLNVTEEFLIEAMNCFRQKYGHHKNVGDYTLIFYPNFDIMRKF